MNTRFSRKMRVQFYPSNSGPLPAKHCCQLDLIGGVNPLSLVKAAI